MIGVGIIGFGTVGIGTFKILRDHRLLIEQRTGLDIGVVKIADIDLDRERPVEVEKGILTADAYEVIDHPDVDVVVELMGGIHPAYEFIAYAAAKKKPVVTANKALLAEKGNEIYELMKKEGCDLGFEAAVAGGIPVIRATRQGLVGNRILYILGILNGTSNYILTKMTEGGVSFPAALQRAQELGYAEKDPTLDVEGIDAAHKLCILARLSFHCPIRMEEITTRGISELSSVDIAFAKEFGYVIKLLAMAKEEEGMVEARVEPTMIPLDHPMASVNGVFNAVYVVGDRTGPNLYYGRGAGGDPTGSAVVSDIVDVAKRIKEGTQRVYLPRWDGRIGVRSGEESSAPYYVRITAHDRPGVLSKVSGVLAQYNISISAVLQKGRQENGYVPIVMVTHEAVEKDLKHAKAEIDALSFIKGESVHIRIEEGKS
jgi:homoserine dehydrogenase